MEFILIVLIFCITLFIYIHIYHHLKTNDDLDIYTIETPTKDKLEEVCNLRQPIKFNFKNDKLCNLYNLEKLNLNYKSYDLKIRNLENIDNMSLPLSLNSTIKLFQTDKLSSFYTENNDDFLEDTELNKNIRHNDYFLRPFMMSNSNYDILSGSKDSYTPLRYHLNYRNYFLVTEGEIKIKLCPPKNKKNIDVVHDYYNLEFRSNDNIWNIDKNDNNLNKIKFIEITIKKGEIIFIPAYWWYSIKFNDNSFILAFYYQTYMNSLSISPHYFLKILQSQNTEHSLNKKIYINDNADNIKNNLNINLLLTDKQYKLKSPSNDKPSNKEKLINKKLTASAITNELKV